MPHYYFHVERDGQRLSDEEGSDHSDLQSVQGLAIRAAADLAAEDLKSGLDSVEYFIVVEDEAGQDLIRVRLFAVVEVQEARSA